MVRNSPLIVLLFSNKDSIKSANYRYKPPASIPSCLKSARTFASDKIHETRIWRLNC